MAPHSASTIPGSCAPVHPESEQRSVEIRLTDGRVALVSPEDAGLASFLWLHNSPERRSGGYAIRFLPDRSSRLMHREVMGLEHGDPICVDHMNGNSLDNRRENLRLATRAQNMRNQRRPGIKGVSQSGNRFVAHIRIGGRLRNLGTHPTPESAARAYDSAAREHFGEFAAVNFPEAGERGCRPLSSLPGGALP